MITIKRRGEVALSTSCCTFRNSLEPRLGSSGFKAARIVVLRVSSGRDVRTTNSTAEKSVVWRIGRYISEPDSSSTSFARKVVFRERRSFAPAEQDVYSLRINVYPLRQERDLNEPCKAHRAPLERRIDKARSYKHRAPPEHFHR